MPTPATLLNIKDNLHFPNKITRAGAVLPRFLSQAPTASKIWLISRRSLAFHGKQQAALASSRRTRRRNEGQGDNVPCRNTMAEVDHPPVPDHGGAVRKAHLDVVMVQKCAVERINGLVDRLLDRKQQAAAKRIVVNSVAFVRRSDDVQQIRGERLGWFDVDPDTLKF